MQYAGTVVLTAYINTIAPAGVLVTGLPVADCLMSGH